MRVEANQINVPVTIIMSLEEAKILRSFLGVLSYEEIEKVTGCEDAAAKVINVTDELYGKLRNALD